MKKTLLATAMLALTTMGWAQTSYQTATEAVTGDNTYTAAEVDSVFWKHTAQKDELLYLTGLNGGYNTTSVYACDGTDVPTASSSPMRGVSQSKTYVYPLKAGQTAYFVEYGQGTLGFSLETKEAYQLGKGLSADDAMPIALEKDIYIGNASVSGYDYYTAYATYTATEDGVLSLSSKGYLGSGTVNGADFSAEYANNQYTAKISVTSGETYNIRFSIYSPILFTATIEHPTAGSLDMPFELKEGENTVPAAYGEYYYTYTPEKKGYFNISSEEELAGGQVLVYSNKSNLNYNSTAGKSEVGSFNVRVEVKYLSSYSGNTYYVKVNKVESTDADQTFTFAMEDYKQGEQESDPISLDLPAENVTVPSAQGNYYYVVDVPANTKKFMVVKAQKSVSSSTTLYVYPQGSSYYYGEYTTDGYVRYDVTNTAAKSYIIRWNSNESEPITFDVSLKDIVQGSVISDPITAQLGENTLVDEGTQYYTYTPTQTGKLSVTVDPESSVDFIELSGSYTTTLDAIVSGSTYSIEGTEGKAMLFSINNAVKDSKFTVSESTFAEGETQSKAIAVGESYTIPTNLASNVWVAYTAPAAGKLKIAVSPLDYNGENVVEYAKSTDDYFSYLISSKEVNGDYITVYEGSTSVVEGDVVYVHMQLTNATEETAITFTLADPEPGESSANPIVLELNKPVIIPIPSYDTPVWVKINANGTDEVKVKANSYVGAYWYASESDLSNEMPEYAYFESTSEGDEYYYLMTVANVQKGACYLQFYRAWEQVELTLLSGADETDGIEAVNAAPNGVVQVYTIDGQKVANQIAGLKAGLYIVSKDGKTQKIMVK